jgi:hypothetical protein
LLNRFHASLSLVAQARGQQQQQQQKRPPPQMVALEELSGGAGKKQTIWKKTLNPIETIS